MLGTIIITDQSGLISELTYLLTTFKQATLLLLRGADEGYSPPSTASGRMDDFRIPSLPSPAHRLWSHILSGSEKASEHRNGRGVPTPIIPPEVPPPNFPLAPSDKIATSMRILLHDTQMNFEIFSKRVDTLLSTVSDAKNETKTINEKFERRYDKMLGDVIDISVYPLYLESVEG